MAEEVVHTIWDFHDAPIEGVADFNGLPHYYEAEWDEDEDDYSSHYRLWPLTAQTFALVLEAWAIWRRWEEAFYGERTTRATHPALPEDRARYDELEVLLRPELKADAGRSFLAAASFTRRLGADWNGVGNPPLAVRWQALEPGESHFFS